MPSARVIVTFDSEKLSAIQQFIVKGSPSVEDQLRDQLEKIYLKSVPAPVRQYIDGKPKPTVQEKKKSGQGAGTHRGDSD